MIFFESLNSKMIRDCLYIIVTIPAAFGIFFGLTVLSIEVNGIFKPNGFFRFCLYEYYLKIMILIALILLVFVLIKIIIDVIIGCLLSENSKCKYVLKIINILLYIFIGLIFISLIPLLVIYKCSYTYLWTSIQMDIVAISFCIPIVIVAILLINSLYSDTK